MARHSDGLHSRGRSWRSILKRAPYRGEIVFGRTKKRNVEGTVFPTRRPEQEWLRVRAEHLRIVPRELAEAVDARFAWVQQRTLRSSKGTLMGRPVGEGAKYLLTGVLSCSVCG